MTRGRWVAGALAAALAASLASGPASAAAPVTRGAAAGTTPTTVTLATDPYGPILSDAVDGGIHLVATITPATATGTIQFTLDGQPTGSPVTISGGQASTTPSEFLLEAGQHTVGATYSGDADHASSSVGPQSFWVSVARTSVSLTVPASVGRYGEATLEATVDSVDFEQPGTVQFTLDGAALGAPVALDSGGTGSLTTPIDVPLGSHTVAVYRAGSQDFSASFATAPLTVVAATSTLTMPQEWQQAAVADDTQLTVQVGPAVDLGTIQMTWTGLGSLDYELVNGAAVVPIRFADGSVTTTVTAAYLGDDDHLPVSVTKSFTLAGAEADAALVSQAYGVTLDRAPDAAGLGYWASRLHAGAVAPTHMTDALATSREGRGRVIRDAYASILDRRPDPSGLAYWQDKLAHGTSPELLRAGLLASDEGYRHDGGTPRDFVTAAYEHHLGRTATRADLDYWVKRLGPAPSRWDRQKAALTISRSTEGTRSAVRAALRDGCGTTEATDAQRSALAAAWATHHHPTRLAGTALVQVSRPTGSTTSS